LTPDSGLAEKVDDDVAGEAVGSVIVALGRRALLVEGDQVGLDLGQTVLQDEDLKTGRTLLIGVYLSVS
jgi:hypothetical protein